MHQSMIATLALGFVLGLKHATEADHLAAVSTIVSERRSIWQSAAVGALWGVGHTASLLLAGILVLGFGLIIPERLANVLELAVAAMIIFLGMRLLHMHVHSHAHGGKSHFHLHFETDPHGSTGHSGLSGYRPLLIGVVHGLAGSAALTLLVLAEVVQNAGAGTGFAYLLIFGLGSIAGMFLMSAVIGVPFTFGARVFKRTLFPLHVLTGVLSTSFGFFYAWKVIGKLGLF